MTKGLPRSLADSRMAAIATLTDSSGGTASAIIAAATNSTALTHAFGTADGTLDDVTATFSQTIMNNNFKELTTQLALQRSLNIVLINAVASLTAKVNATLNAVK